MDFNKIKMSGVRVELHWVTSRGGSEEKHELTSYEAAAPEFAASMAAFAAPVLDLLELPQSFAEGFAVIGLSINTEESGRRGLVVTCLRKLAAANAPLVLNTPHLREEQEGDQAGKYLPAKMLDLIDAAQRHATAFVNGTRAQGDLFTKSASEPVKRSSAQCDALNETTISLNGGPAVPLSVARKAMDIVTGRDRAVGRDA